MTTSVLSTDHLRVAEQIRAAFDGVPRPRPDAIALHPCADCSTFAAALAPYAWQALPDSVIEAHPSDLPLLGPEAFVYYLPAYVLYALSHFQYYNLVTEMTLYSLSPAEDYTPEEGPGEHLCERLKPFTHDQIEAAEAFLLFAESDEDFRRYHGDLGPARRRLRALWEARWTC